MKTNDLESIENLTLKGVKNIMAFGCETSTVNYYDGVSIMINEDIDQVIEYLEQFDEIGYSVKYYSYDSGEYRDEYDPTDEDGDYCDLTLIFE
jgi:hypothetical protein